ncbi:MAG: GNAT family N-acetyltransferase [Pseudomonadota bacterium]
MSLRRARPKDAATCAAILREWIDETPWFPTLHPPSADVRFLEKKIPQMTVSGDPARGFIAVEDDYVSCLYVGRAHRQDGLGRALLEDAMARNTSLRLWTFQANTGAQRFYLRAGFTEAQRTDGADNEEKLPDIEYVWHAGGRP